MADALRVVLDEEQLDWLADLIADRLNPIQAKTPSPWLTVTEAADLLRCQQHRVRDLLSARTLTTYKEGRRTLLGRAEVMRHVREEPK